MTDLSSARWTQVTGGHTLVVPVGSLEQHGPHLPLDTDTRIATEIVHRACADAPAGTWAAPPITIGASGEHAAFPGTLSIGTPALAATLIELGRHATGHWTRLIFANAHGGNTDALRAAYGTLQAEGRDITIWHASTPSGDAHAGRTETSLMLAIDPAAVALDHAAPGDTRSMRELLPLLRSSGVREASPNGVLGDPSGATAEEGERLLGTLAASLRTTLGGP